MFNTRGGGVKGRLNNVKQTELLAKDGFPKLGVRSVLYIFRKSFEKETAVTRVNQNHLYSVIQKPSELIEVGWFIDILYDFTFLYTSKHFTFSNTIRILSLSSNFDSASWQFVLINMGLP